MTLRFVATFHGVDLTTVEAYRREVRTLWREGDSAPLLRWAKAVHAPWERAEGSQWLPIPETSLMPKLSVWRDALSRCGVEPHRYESLIARIQARQAVSQWCWFRLEEFDRLAADHALWTEGLSRNLHQAGTAGPFDLGAAVEASIRNLEVLAGERPFEARPIDDWIKVPPDEWPTTTLKYLFHSFDRIDKLEAPDLPALGIPIVEPAWLPESQRKRWLIRNTDVVGVRIATHDELADRLDITPFDGAIFHIRPLPATAQTT